MRVTSFQLEIRERSKKETLDYVLAKLSQLRGNDLILLPEIWPVGYFSFDRYASESEPLDGPTVKAIQKKAAEIHAYILMGSIVERDGNRLYNTTLLVDSTGKTIARYRKIHLFGYQSDESRLLQRGEEIVVVQTPWGMAGLSTCYDLRFPELYRKMLDLGAHFFLVTSAWPYARLEAWKLFNRVRAHENLAYLFSCNCVGINQGRQLAGHSMFVDPLGVVVASGDDKECLVSEDVDMERVNSARNDFSALKDRVLK